MSTSWKKKIDDIVLEAINQNPFLTSLNDEAQRTFAKGLANAIDTILPEHDTPLSDVARVWTTYQFEMANFWLRALSQTGAAVSDTDDPRFQSDAWKKGIFPHLRQSYEITAKILEDMADNAGLPELAQRKMSFYARFAADSMSPSNYLLTNPEVLELAQQTNGQSLIDGFQNIISDIKKGYMSTTDETAFEIGRNLATTSGSVIFKNELIEVIQYTPTQKKVRSNPVLIVPPCVNKFYIFDINERKSMVRYLLDHGQNVFMLVWRNAGKDTNHYGWEEYLQFGIFQALSVAAEVSGSESVDMMSWCNGGSMLLAALSVMPDELKTKVATATFLSSMIDFSDPGEVQVFFDQPEVASYNARLTSKKLAPGRDIAQAMAMLHANESIWNFVVSKYLKGEAPAPFDILYWNSDTANIPAPWYRFYAEEMYLKNKLKEPGALTLLGRPVDTRNINLPCYFVAASEDHIVPWKTSYDAISLVSGPTEFVLTPGGHVSGTVINHPTKNRRHFFTNGDQQANPNKWKETSKRTEGSWWPHWLAWIEENNPCVMLNSQKRVGNKKFAPLYDAPGQYILEAVE